MSTSAHSPSRRREEDSAEAIYESDMDASIEFDESAGIATFSSGLRYSIRDLDTGTKDAIVKALSTPSRLTLRGCSPPRGQDYLFLVSETIDYHVRASEGTGPYGGSDGSPSCSCQQDERSMGLQHPCRHTLWLCDQILSQLVPLSEQPYTWALDGYTAEHGNVCHYISDYHLDVLADGLRCDIMTGESMKPRPRRIQTAREILATLSGNSLDKYRPDLTGEATGKRVVKEGDIEETVFRMLLENDSLLSYFLVSMRNHGPLNPRFRRFRDRTDAALDTFDTYAKALDLGDPKLLEKVPEWCYRTISDILRQIKALIDYPERELDNFDRRAAASTLIYILGQVVSRNEDHKDIRDNNNTKTVNLYRDLVIKLGNNFVIDLLDTLSPDSFEHMLPDLDRIEEKIANTNVPASYLNKFDEIVTHIRNANLRSMSESTESSRKRMNQDDDRLSKRVK
ncbi:hypothetical protein F4777DRAFT_589572 [Nemania sp. FL0916]|nr:hypothetical protein F4777DRAFT_589572 [Nemania sp. FL0916]